MSFVPAPSDELGWRSTATWTWTAVTVLAATIGYGTVYWTTPYDELDIGSLTLAVYAVAALPVVALRATGVAPFLLSAAVSPVALAAAVMVRVAVDVARDPTSHNLWPIEIVVAVVVGAVWGLIAAGVGELVLRVRRPG